MSTERPIATDAQDKPRRLTWLWVTSFGLLALVAAFSLLVLGPYLQVRRSLVNWENSAPAQRLAALGGAKAAERRLSLYIELPDRFAPDKEMAVQLLGHCGPSVTPRLVELLEHSKPFMRSCTITALGNTRDPRAVDLLIAMMKDPAENMRGNVAMALSMAKDPRAIEPLIAALHDTRDYDCLMVITALGFLGDPRAIPSLEELVEWQADQTVVKREQHYALAEAVRQAVERIQEASKQGQPQAQ